MNRSLLTAATCHADASWRDAAHVRVLENDVLRVTLHTGIPVEIVDKPSGRSLIRVAVEQIPGQLAVFGARQLDLGARQGSTSAFHGSRRSIPRAPPWLVLIRPWQILRLAGTVNRHLDGQSEL